MRMNKRIIALALAAATIAMSTAAFAQKIDMGSRADVKRAILMCYDENDVLVYSKLHKDTDGTVIDVPSQYDNTKKKIYYVDTKELVEAENAEPEPTQTPAATEEPQSDENPAATAKPQTESTPYEKEVDGIYAPAIVTEVESDENKDGEGIYAVTLFYHGKEMKIDIDEDLKISTAPDAYSYMKGQTMESLEKGDVICMTASIAGDEIRTVDFIFRPTAEDIITGDADYGENFEKLYASGGKVAEKWSYMKYGEKPSKDKYQYAFGVVGRMNNNTLTLLNKNGVTDEALEIDVNELANVYICDVSGKEYEVEAGSGNDITASIPSKYMSDDKIDLNGDYSYNYALVRLVDDTATDVVLYTNYND